VTKRYIARKSPRNVGITPSAGKRKAPCVFGFLDHASSARRSANSTWSWTFSKKELALSIEGRRLWIDPQHPRLSVQQQCELLGLPRSTYYYQPRPESAENLSHVAEFTTGYFISFTSRLLLQGREDQQAAGPERWLEFGLKLHSNDTSSRNPKPLTAAHLSRTCIYPRALAEAIAASQITWATSAPPISLWAPEVPCILQMNLLPSRL
jgi:hypothetical protein